MRCLEEILTSRKDLGPRGSDVHGMHRELQEPSGFAASQVTSSRTTGTESAQS